MKDVHCNVIQDLLPLYIDNCCSESSRNMVAEHLLSCTCCKQVWAEMTEQVSEIEISACSGIEEECPEEKPAKFMKKGFQKLRRRLIAAVVSVLLFFSLGKLCLNEFFWGSGICFSNINDLCIADAFMRDLKNGNYDAALEHWALDDLYKYFLSDHFDEKTLANFDEDAKTQFLASTKKLADAGGITDYRRTGVMWHAVNDEGKKVYRVFYSATIDGKKITMSISVDNNGIQYIFGEENSRHNPDSIATIGWWTYILWENYEGCYWDPKTGEFIYYK